MEDTIKCDKKCEVDSSGKTRCKMGKLPKVCKKCCDNAESGGGPPMHSVINTNVDVDWDEINDFAHDLVNAVNDLDNNPGDSGAESDLRKAFKGALKELVESFEETLEDFEEDINDEFDDLDDRVDDIEDELD